MTIFEAIVLGLIQGLTEFIPISSSGHLVLAQRVFGHGADHLFVEFINIGTVLALIIYFWPRITKIFREIFVGKNWRLARNVFISAVPAGLLGLLLAGFIETHPFFASAWVIAATLFIVGVFLIVLEKIPKLSATQDGEALTTNRALGIGLAQVFALIPGTSRSGATIIAGRIAGLSPTAAAEYSFLLSIPIMLGVIVKLFMGNFDYFTTHFMTIIISNTVALISGLVAVGFLMRYLANHSLALFGWYRVALALVVAGVLLIQ